MMTKSIRLLFAGYLLSVHHLTFITILTIECTSGFSFSYIRQHTASPRFTTTPPQRQHTAISKRSPQSREYLLSLKSTPVDNDDTNTVPKDGPNDDDDDDESSSSSAASLRKELRQRVKNIKVKKKIGDAIAKTLDIRLVRSVTPAPQVIGAVLRDSARGAVSEIKPTIDRWTTMPGDAGQRQSSSSSGGRGILEQMQRTPPTSTAESIAAMMDETRGRMTNAFSRADDAIVEAERAMTALNEAKRSLALAKDDVFRALLDVEEALLLSTTVVDGPVVGAPSSASPVPAVDLEPSDLTDIADLSYDDIDFSLSEMAPPFIGDDQCLVPGVPLVRVEKAPENSRRIFAGIDIMASVDDVWKALTDYARLQDIVPNLVVNEVLELYDPSSSSSRDDVATSSSSEEDQCRDISRRMKGAKLRQVGGAKVVGINFSARTTLEVREWPDGLPDYAHFNDDVWEGKSRNKRIQEGKRLPLRRYRFPRPFAISKLPTRDISMQSVEGDDGEFRLYQGVWRMQPLPGCAPRGSAAMRLTYAVEISPRAYLPVQLVEKRIANDLMNNLEAIRDAVTTTTPV